MPRARGPAFLGSGQAGIDPQLQTKSSNNSIPAARQLAQAPSK